MAYHYKESGLDNIYLRDGYTIHKTAYGKGVSIADTEGLHRGIGRWLISLPKSLNGAELRFLRIEMDMTQRNLAAILGTKEQTLSLWERHRNKAMPGSADRLLRALYGDYIKEDGSVRSMLERLAELDQIKQPKEACWHETRRGWQLEA
jgi:putative transcriptional regulator